MIGRPAERRESHDRRQASREGFACLRILMGRVPRTSMCFSDGSISVTQPFRLNRLSTFQIISLRLLGADTTGSPEPSGGSPQPGGSPQTDNAPAQVTPLVACLCSGETSRCRRD